MKLIKRILSFLFGWMFVKDQSKINQRSIGMHALTVKGPRTTRPVYKQGKRVGFILKYEKSIVEVSCE
jgi:hypothetical protein